MGSRPRLHEGRLSAGTTEVEGGGMTCGWRKGDGSPHPRGHRRGRSSRLRLHEGRLCAGTTEVGARDDMWVAEGGWVPASARTQEGEEFPPSSARGQALCGNNGGGGGRDDMWVTEGGWVPASAGTQEGEEFPHPSSRGQAMREDTGGGGFHPHPGLPPQGGRAVREPPLQRGGAGGRG